MKPLWNDLHDAIWRYVLDWNALWLNPESGEYERLLPPAQVGPDQFKAINNNLVSMDRLGVEDRTLARSQPPKRCDAFKRYARAVTRRQHRLPTAESTLPQKPADYDLVMWYDLSPLRPEEYLNTRADTWTEAVQLRNAALDGIASAKAEAGAYAAVSRGAESGRGGVVDVDEKDVMSRTRNAMSAAMLPASKPVTSACRGNQPGCVSRYMPGPASESFSTWTNVPVSALYALGVVSRCRTVVRAPQVSAPMRIPMPSEMMSVFMSSGF
jgi:hypothetical protein